MNEIKILTSRYIDYFQSEGNASIPFLVNNRLSSLILGMEYKRLPPIPEEQKPELTAYINELFPEKTEEEKIKAMQVVYTIGVLI
jgi:hypothetical protein